MMISCVIVAKHAEKTLRDCVNSLLNQTFKPQEIIVVVDSLADPTVKAVKDLPVKIVLNEDTGLGAARKTGVSSSTGDAIAFIDADCIADERLIESLVEAFIDSNVMVQAGRVIGVKSLSGTSTSSLELCSKNPRFLKFAPTLNFAFRKELVNIVGSFDPWFKGGGEDLDFCVRLKKAGYRIAYNPKAAVYHFARLNIRGLLRRSIRDGKSRAQAFVKHGTALLSAVSIAFIHSFLTLSAIALFTLGHSTLALFALLMSIGHRTYRGLKSADSRNISITLLWNYILIYLSYAAFCIYVVRFLCTGRRYAR